MFIICNKSILKYLLENYQIELCICFYYSDEFKYVDISDFFFLPAIWCHAGSIIMEVTPSDGKAAIGSQVSVQCQLQNAGSGESLLWYRRQGNFSYKIGNDGLLTLRDGSVVAGQRYDLAQDQTTDNGIRNCRLTIRGKSKLRLQIND